MPTDRKSARSANDAPESQRELQLRALKSFRILLRAAQRHSTWVEKQCGVNAAQLWILCELHETPGLRVGEVAMRLGVHQTTLSNLLDGLGRRGYVRKERDPSDARAVTLFLSDSGNALLSNAPEPTRGLLMASIAKLEMDELEQLVVGLEAMMKAGGDVDEQLGLQPLPFMM